MNMLRPLIMAFLNTVAGCSVVPPEDPPEVAVFVPDCGGVDVAGLARRHGFRLLGPVGSLACTFRLQQNAARRGAVAGLSADPRVTWLQSQRTLKRTKRDGPTHDAQRVHQPLAPLGRQDLPDLRLPWRDPLYQYQWYLKSGGVNGWDMGVQQAWEAGFSGRNVTVTILDDGIQTDHPDLAPNYEPLASYDVNDGDSDPTPENIGENRHGTRCAGSVSAVAGNDWCGVGVAFNARIGGIRMLDGRVTDGVEAASFSHAPQVVDIYSASWGPDDDGQTLDGPGTLARQAIQDGAVSGRGGLGSIFVMGSGNGGRNGDSCSYDGYATSVYTLTVSSATQQNQSPWYLERCPATIATTYSSGGPRDAAIVTTDEPYSCTKAHTGTSASVPIAAALVALALEANPRLSWRDVQHVVVRTADPRPLLYPTGWSRNGVGRRVSQDFGFGLMNASAMATLAQAWSPVPDQHICSYTQTDFDERNPLKLAGESSHNITFVVSGCEETSSRVLYLEHVLIRLKVKLSRRGALKASLRSPSGTNVVLLPGRPRDHRRRAADFRIWPILSVHTWGEDPRGNWTLSLDMNGNASEGTLFHCSLDLYGTGTPAQQTDAPHSAAPPPEPELNEMKPRTTIIWLKSILQIIIGGARYLIN